MSFKLTSMDYILYIKETKDVLEHQKEYITDLDAATGDGDHWANLYMGFTKIMEKADVLSTLSISDTLKQIGMIMLSSIGGSSGALYGSGYIAASKAIKGAQYLDIHTLYEMFNAMLLVIMERGKTKPGQKTMVDSLCSALCFYEKGLKEELDENTILAMFVEGAKKGANDTLQMEACKGRASYRKDKGIGHLDPGAITMSLQLECLGNYIENKEEK